MQAMSTTQGHLAWLAPEHHDAEEPPALLSTLAMMPGTPQGSVAGLPAAGGCNGGLRQPCIPSHLNFCWSGPCPTQLGSLG